MYIKMLDWIFKANKWIRTNKNSFLMKMAASPNFLKCKLAKYFLYTNGSKKGQYNIFIKILVSDEPSNCSRERREGKASLWWNVQFLPQLEKIRCRPTGQMLAGKMALIRH